MSLAFGIGNHNGDQYLKLSMPEDAWSLKAVIKTSRGTHWMSFDRWGDSTHKMSTYNNRKHPSHKDQMYIDRMEAENMVMFHIRNLMQLPDPILWVAQNSPKGLTKGQKI